MLCCVGFDTLLSILICWVFLQRLDLTGSDTYKPLPLVVMNT